ncbi:orotate phosphoribosyltransferase [Candidatus Kinetoplastidibacterium crithidiae]|uniref:Orotate phosphoribosyltransferase n=1 Tax=Candidatus Kinetoplastidibacterium crithidiae TCC036E TaxID=1208918 RepID=M1L5N7_9PROT|nr:orotate phosphoribosyltransferase [Candidatus Kinetoplastibacterium crithidii]AFZ82949.1 orotate phosphoribosyltransferase [Candidatus Kinetoplastibacterium crithidii (ex Angomonas deanei ATCC 30255)]AGF47948.1 orotate phosphoribosyltransferase [Candidatus Kinetoplastibacterium crithidii TCC036E]
MVIDEHQALDFVKFALDVGALKFGDFKTKSDRISPYFFNIGLFNNGKSIAKLAEFYANILQKSSIEFDMLFGPAYKGIPLVISTSMILSDRCIHEKVPFAFNRKEAKNHGEKGRLIGASLHGKVVIIDDVITSGISVNESIEIIHAEGAEPVAVIVALDRMEKPNLISSVSEATTSASNNISSKYGLPVLSIASLENILSLVQKHQDFAEHAEKVAKYRSLYGIG